jgi:hypothetical protein
MATGAVLTFASDARAAFARSESLPAPAGRLMNVLVRVPNAQATDLPVTEKQCRPLSCHPANPSLARVTTRDGLATWPRAPDATIARGAEEAEANSRETREAARANARVDMA